MYKMLRVHSLVTVSEEPKKPSVIPMVDGQMVRVKEGEQDFILNVQVLKLSELHGLLFGYKFIEGRGGDLF